MMVRGRELTPSAWWTGGGVIVILAILTAAGIWYTGITNARQDRQWCELLEPLSEAYRAAPPTTETGRRVAAAIEHLRARKGCAP